MGAARLARDLLSVLEGCGGLFYQAKYLHLGPSPTAASATPVFEEWEPFQAIWKHVQILNMD